MSHFNIGLSAQLYQNDGTVLVPEVDLTPLKNQPNITLSELPAVGTGLLEHADVAHLDAAVLFLEKVTSDTFGDSSNLTLLARYGVGYDTLDIPACTDAGVAVAIAPQGVRRPVATSVVALLLALTMKLTIKDRITRDVPDGWSRKTDHNGMGLVGRTLGTIGVGNIGAEVFRLMQPFDMRMIAHDPFVDQSIADSLGIELVSLDEVFRQSDVLSVHCPLSPATRHIVNAERLALMKSNAYLINTSRGPVVDEEALINALQTGKISGAGLDVFEQEPPDSGNPLLSMENVILTPHALCFTDQCLAGLGAADVEACLQVYKGYLPESLVNPEVSESSRFAQRLKTYAQNFRSQA